MKNFKSLLCLFLFMIAGTSSFGEGNSLFKYDCADVTFSCGATGYVCGNANESLVDRAWKLDGEICG
ncbi:MAG: hypothetical protein ABJH05_13630 [Fulvivirga sp.]